MGANKSKMNLEKEETERKLISNRYPDEGTQKVTYGKPNGIPTVIRWAGGPANTVRLMGDFNKWDKTGIPLNKSGDDFYVILNLLKGEHEIKFIVDNKVSVDNTQPTVTSSGQVNNLIIVSDDSILNTESEENIGKAASKDEEGYGHEEVLFEETRKYPPLCPPHLRFSPLNSSPQKRFFCNTSSVNTNPRNSKVFLPSGDPCVLPTPLHVTVNHVYFQRRDGYSLMGTTCRYKSKYCTVVFYKPDKVVGTTTTSAPVPVPQRIS